VCAALGVGGCSPGVLGVRGRNGSARGGTEPPDGLTPGQAAAGEAAQG